MLHFWMPSLHYGFWAIRVQVQGILCKSKNQKHFYTYESYDYVNRMALELNFEEENHIAQNKKSNHGNW